MKYKPFEPEKPLDWKYEKISAYDTYGVMFDLSTVKDATHIDIQVHGEYDYQIAEIIFYKKIPCSAKEMAQANKKYETEYKKYLENLKVYEEWEKENLAKTAEKTQEKI